ncbi:MAG: NAD-dependent epimerase/dehydratase family protein [Desulfurococcales archaeon]|nr:NAD-dependent epimerase/dehydratase family protein [Desulfurococcales archaeon]
MVFDVRVIVTGGAGFIGSHLTEKLSIDGHEVIVIDNLSSGKLSNIAHLVNAGKATFVKGDLKDPNGAWVRYFDGADAVFHFAANPEVRVSVTNPRIHFDENVLATFNVLEQCRVNDVNLLVFASSSTVYGDAKEFPTPEDYQPLEPISVYGAAKLACEYLIISYSKLYGIKSLILRFANIVGPRQTHGVIVDFIRKLRANPKVLEILGDGTQRKSYLHVQDLLTGIDYSIDFLLKSGISYAIFNVGNDDWITVNEIAKIVIEEMGLSNVRFTYRKATEDGRGWKGDVKFMLLDNSKLKSLGWRPKYSSAEAIRYTVRALLKEL